MRCAPSASAVDDDGHPRDVGLLGAADGQRIDVETAAPKQRDHPVSTPGLSST